MTKRTLVTLILIFLFTGSALADKIELEDGSVIVGKVISETDDTVTIETETMGTMEIKRTEIAFIYFDDIERAPLSRYTKIDRTGRKLRFAGHDPDYNSIMFCPTPATVEKGDTYFRNFELFFLNWGYGITDRMSLSVGGLFPITSSILMVSGGLKYEILNREQYPLGLAIAGSYTATKDSKTGMVNLITGFGNMDRSVNLSLSKTFDMESDTESGWLYCFGADFRMTQGSKFLIEYCNSEDWSLNLDEDGDDEFLGLVNVGFRWFGSRWSFSLTGLRPLLEDSGNFLAFPMAMFSMHF